MHAATRPYAVAGAALSAVSLYVVTPVGSQPLQPPTRSIDVRLVDSGSLIDVPFNLFQDIVNIPATNWTRSTSSGTHCFSLGPG